MATTKEYSFFPDNGELRYSDIADRVSVSAMHVFNIMLASGYAAHFSYAQIERIAKDAHHFHSTLKLDENLSELEKAKGLMVETRDT